MQTKTTIKKIINNMVFRIAVLFAALAGIALFSCIKANAMGAPTVPGYSYCYISYSAAKYGWPGGYNETSAIGTRKPNNIFSSVNTGQERYMIYNTSTLAYIRQSCGWTDFYNNTFYWEPYESGYFYMFNLNDVLYAPAGYSYPAVGSQWRVLQSASWLQTNNTWHPNTYDYLEMHRTCRLFAGGQTISWPAAMKDKWLCFCPNWIANYTVNYASGGGTGSAPANQTFLENTAGYLRANTFSKSYTVYFNGNGGTPATGSKAANCTFQSWKGNRTGVTYASGGYVANPNYGSSKFIDDPQGTYGNTTTTMTAQWSAGKTTLPSASRTGYTFAGWYTAASGGTYVGTTNSSYSTNGNVTLYAHWTPNTYNVALNQQSGTGGTTQIKVQYGVKWMLANGNQMTGSANPITKPTRKHTVTFDKNGGNCSTASLIGTKTFGGYYTGTNGTGVQYINQNGYITGSASTVNTGNITLSNNNGTLYAKWTGGGITLPNATRTGYRFDGWWTAKSGGTRVGGYNGGYTPNANTTLYAHWTPIVYTITLDNKDATTNGTGVIYEKYATGWYTGSTKGTETFTNPNQTVTKYTVSGNAVTKIPTIPKREYTVTYNPNNTNPQSSGYNGVSNPTSNVAKYVFNGYYQNNTQRITGDGTLPANTTFTSDTTLTAKWTAVSVTLASATRRGYTFDGWWTAASGGNKIGNAGESYTPTQNVTLYAHWKANTYEIDLDANRISGSLTTDGTDSIFETYDTKYSLTNNGAAMTATQNKITVPTRTYVLNYDLMGGYLPRGTQETQVEPVWTFNGYWLNASTEAAGTQYIGANGYFIPDQAVPNNTKTNRWANDWPTNPNLNAPLKLYAHWNPNTTILPTPRKLGYVFVEWNREANGSGAGFAAGYNYGADSLKDETLHAIWRYSSYNVKFHSNYGADATSVQQIQRDFPTPLNANPFTRDGYTFVGWSDTPNGNVLYNDRTAVTNLKGDGETIDLYAIWQDDAEILFVDKDSGEAPQISKNADNLGKYLVIETKSTPGYLMDGTRSEITDIDTGSDPQTYILDGEEKEVYVNGLDKLANMPFTNTPNSYTIEKVDETGKLLANFDTYGEWIEGDSAQFTFHVEGMDAGETIATYTMTTETHDVYDGSDVYSGSVTRSTTEEYPLVNDGTITVDSTGHINLQRLHPGVWTLKETRAHKNMSLNPTKYTVIVDENGYLGGKQESGSVRVINTESGMYITKLDKGGVPLPGIRFEVRQGSETANPVSYTTDEFGMINLSTLMNEAVPNSGDTSVFYVNEASAENQTSLPEGVIVSDTSKHTINVKKDGIVSYVQVDGGEWTRVGMMTIYNDVNSFRIRKVDTETQEPLADAVFKIWKEDSDEVYENIRSHEDGYTDLITGISSGTWHVKETAPPPGKILDDREYTFIVDPITHLITFSE